MTRATIVSVTRHVAGSALLSPLGIGDDTVTVYDSSDFPDAGFLSVAGNVLRYLSVDDGDDDTDPTDPTITLAAASPVAVTDGRVDVAPLTVTYDAVILRRGATTQEPAVVAEHVARGIKTGTGSAGWVVRIEWDDDDEVWVVHRILSRDPSVNLSYATDDPINPLAVTNSLAAEPEAYNAAIPAPAVGSGEVSADLAFTGKASFGGVVVGGTQGLDVALDGASPMRITDQGIRDAGIGDKTMMRTSTGPNQLGGDTKIPAGSSVILGRYLDPPALGPNFTEDSPSVDVQFGAVPVSQRRGLAVKSLTDLCFTTATKGSGGTNLLVFNGLELGSGVLVDHVPFTGAPTPTVVADIFYSLLNDKIRTLEFDSAAAQWLIRTYTYTPTVAATYVSQWVVAELGSAATPLPGIGGFKFGSSEFLTVARSNSDGTITFYRYTDAVHTTDFDSTDAFDFGGGTVAVDLQIATLGGDSVVVTGPMNMVCDGSLPNTSRYVGQTVMPVISTDPTFWLPTYGLGDSLGAGVVADGDRQACGIADLDGSTNFPTYYLSGLSNSFKHHSNFFESGAHCLQVTYLDSMSHETLPSDPIFFFKTPGRRTTLTYGKPPPNSAATAVGFYVGSGGTYPGNAAMFRAGLPLTTADDYTSAVLFNLPTGTANPPTVPTLTDGGDPGAVRGVDGSAAVLGTYSNAHDLDYRLLAAELFALSGDIIGGTA